jgi:inner membrane protein
MDPLSQGTLGASLPSLGKKKDEGFWPVFLIGFISGLAPDLDVLIRSKTDPLLFLEFHRQFTHSLIFIPVGGFICGALLYSIYFKKKLSFKRSILLATMGYGTHGLLDACTSYGTQLLWPFSDARIAWNNISIIDPLLTLPLLISLLLSVVLKRKIFNFIGFSYIVLYLFLGLWQQYQVERLAGSKVIPNGQQVLSISAKPSFANLILWKVVRETKDRYYVDAVRLLPWSSPVWIEGDSIAKLDIKRDLPWLKADSKQAKDLERFRWFSQGYIALDPQDTNKVIDIRYSILPHQVKALWGIRFSPDHQSEHVEYIVGRDTSKGTRQVFWSMLKGEF